jgi:hypothetical protein
MQLCRKPACCLDTVLVALSTCGDCLIPSAVWLLPELVCNMIVTAAVTSTAALPI